jgi:hypothetical protein
MGFFDLLLQLFRPLRLDDPVFGRLLFIRVPGGGYWEGRGAFAPADGEVEWFIEAGEAGPTARDRAFLQTLETRFPELLSRIHPLIAASGSPWGDAPGEPAALARMLSAISLPDQDRQPLAWELVFESPGPDGRHHTAVMRDWEVDLVRVDD